MKLKEGMVLEQAGDDYVAVATGESAKFLNGLVRNNKTAQFLFEQLQTEKTVDDLVAALLGRYDVAEAVARKDVAAFVEQLKKTNLLDD